MRATSKLLSVRLQAPFYAHDAHAGLHRYLDTEFISRFQQDVRRRVFQQTQFSAWMKEDAQGRLDDKPVLRLPIHRAFHLACCEVVCNQAGHPALCARRITSAGFVIRRMGNGRELAWMVEEGEARGWQAAPVEARDPDIYRRLCASGVLHKRADEPAYSGEQTHPLHTLDAVDADDRHHTLLYGYVPLGGFYYLPQSVAAFDDASQRQVESAAAEQLPWPFGFRKPLVQTWRGEHGRPVVQGRPSPAMFELLGLLTGRYHLGERHLDDNQALERLCDQLYFYNEAAMSAELRGREFSDADAQHFAPYRRGSLQAYLKQCGDRGPDNPLVRWRIRQEQAIEAAGGMERLAHLEKLPGAVGGTLSDALLIGAGDAQNLRQLLGQRFRDQTLAKVKEIPLPKFGHQAGDVYQIVAFARFLNDEGKEQMQWADANARGPLFRVAAPFDPQASRPSLIQMPGLADLKRGLAQGVSMLTPGDTFNLISRLKMNKGAGPDALPDGEPGPDLGIQWICSFSLPVLTLVAMILLMIMISLLNIVFFWMPWARICLPFPKMNK